MGPVYCCNRKIFKLEIYELFFIAISYFSPAVRVRHIQEKLEEFINALNTEK